MCQWPRRKRGQSCWITARLVNVGGWRKTGSLLVLPGESQGLCPGERWRNRRFIVSSTQGTVCSQFSLKRKSYLPELLGFCFILHFCSSWLREGPGGWVARGRTLRLSDSFCKPSQRIMFSLPMTFIFTRLRTQRLKPMWKEEGLTRNHDDFLHTVMNVTAISWRVKQESASFKSGELHKKL